MDKNLKYAFWIIIAGLVGYWLLIGYLIANEMNALAVVVGIGGLAFCCYGWYIGKKERAKNAKELATVQNQIQNDYKSAIAPFYADMRRNYYCLFNKLRIPTDATKIDVETTVFGLPCLAIPTAGQAIYYKNDFYMWKDGSTILIFPTEEHLADSHIRFRTRTQDLPTRLDPNDIGVFKIDIADIEYYLIAGQETSEFRIEGGGSSGPNIAGAVIGGILAGEAGAIIGGMPEPKPVYSYTKYNEGRCVELVYKKSGRVQKIKLSYPAFPFLEQWMPEKEYSYVIANSGVNNS